MIVPNWQKALQSYLLNNQSIESNRVWFLKVEQWNWVAIVFNEWNRSNPDWANIWFEQWIDIFPVLIDVVCKYEDYIKWYEVRNSIRKFIWKFNWKLTNDWEGTIAFRQFLSPVYNKDTNEIVLWWVYLLKQNFDYREDDNEQESGDSAHDEETWAENDEIPTSGNHDDDLTNENTENANNTD